MTDILVVNAGSSSIKFALFGAPTGAGLQPELSGEVTEIGGAAELRIGQARAPCDAPDHKAALAACLAALKSRGVEPGALQAAAHRVVHGGSALVATCRITPAVVAQIEACAALAPLHNPANLAAIRALGALVPDLAQYASFDTAFHATMPDVAARYALPPEAEALGLRRFGFHGISYASLVARLPGLTG
ncbi:MAG: acetate kinase, partial [Paracoccaceae bacterium]|nr:acetate kinase [Paracoccaceae bacterium]